MYEYAERGNLRQLLDEKQEDTLRRVASSFSQDYGVLNHKHIWSLMMVHVTVDRDSGPQISSCSETYL